MFLFWMAATTYNTTWLLAASQANAAAFAKGFSDKSSGALDLPCAADFIDGKWVKREAK